MSRPSRPMATLFLILYDADSESLYCIPVVMKAVTDSVVRCVVALIDELGYGQIKISIKSDRAPELLRFAAG